MSGAGSSRAGTAPYGVGTPAAAPIPGGRNRERIIDNRVTNSRYIDPVTKDYVMNADGRWVGVDGVRGAMHIAVATVRNSSAFLMGHELDKIRTIGPAIDKEIEATFRTGCAHLTDAKLAEILSVTTVRVKDGALRIRLSWKDLTTTKIESTELDL